MDGRIHALPVVENAAALALWEASVRASHEFVAEEDVCLYRSLVDAALAARDVLFYGRYRLDGSLAAFMAVEKECGGMLEMLFVAPEERGQGHGSALFHYAFARHKVRRVDVNEQNPAARRFYEKMGFMIMARSEEDGSGRPYPLLHMEFIPSPPEQS